LGFAVRRGEVANQIGGYFAPHVGVEAARPFMTPPRGCAGRLPSRWRGPRSPNHPHLRTRTER